MLRTGKVYIDAELDVDEIVDSEGAGDAHTGTPSG